MAGKELLVEIPGTRQTLRNPEQIASLLFALLFYAISIAGCSTAFATVGTPMADVLCEIVDWFQGNLGSGLATIGISAVAVGAIFGKVSWGLALTVAVGVCVMFGAATVLVEINMIPAAVC